MVGSQNRRRMSQIRQWQTCLHSSESTWKMNAQVAKSYLPPPWTRPRDVLRLGFLRFYLPKAEWGRASHPRHVETMSRRILRKAPFSPLLLCVAEVVVVGGGGSCVLLLIPKSHCGRRKQQVESGSGPPTNPVGGWHGFINQGAVLISLRYWRASLQ